MIIKIFKGPETARLAIAITIGRRIAEAIGSNSCISIKPWELVAVKERAPVPDAPMTALIAECSDSTVTNSA